MDLHAVGHGPSEDRYLIGPGAAWFAFAMTVALMVFDYVDRQVIVSLFPHLKAEWGLSDKELGGLVSIVSITVAVGGIPIALVADRFSRVRSIVAMAGAWSLATISCMFVRSYAALFAARAVVGLGEAGYGSVGAGLLASHFPARLRGTLMAGFFACASFGSVLGVILGGVIADHWGWKAAFGVVGIPGLVLALLYLFVRDYQTVELTPKVSQGSLVSQASRQSLGGTLKHIFGTLARTPTLLWVCIAGAMQLVTASAVMSWLPSYLNRFHGMTPAAAGKQTALVILIAALAVVLWGIVVDRLARRKPRNKLPLLSVLCVATAVIFMVAFGGPFTGDAQFKLIELGGFFMTAIMGVIVGIAMDVIHPGMRSTGAAVLSLFLNLLGLAVGPFLAGVLSDQWGLQQALAFIPLFSVLAAALFIVAMRSYDADVAQISDVKLDVAPPVTGQLSTGAAA